MRDSSGIDVFWPHPLSDLVLLSNRSKLIYNWYWANSTDLTDIWENHPTSQVAASFKELFQPSEIS